MGAFIPIIPFFFLSGFRAVIWAAVISLLAHFAVGASKFLITVRSWWSSGFEMTAIGAVEGIVTYVIGIALGRMGTQVCVEAKCEISPRKEWPTQTGEACCRHKSIKLPLRARGVLCSVKGPLCQFGGDQHRNHDGKKKAKVACRWVYKGEPSARKRDDVCLSRP